MRDRRSAPASTAQSEWNLLDPDVLDWTFESEPDLQLLNSLFELRNVVESAAAGMAAKRRSAAHLQAMRAALDGMATHTLATEAGRQADLDFHTTLLTATNNPFIISLTNGVNAAISTTTIFKQRKRPLRRDPLPDHLRVFEAITAREAAKAEQAMSELIELARIDTPASSRRRAIAAAEPARRAGRRPVLKYCLSYLMMPAAPPIHPDHHAFERPAHHRL